MGADVKVFDRFIGNSIRLSALLMLYSAISWIGSEAAHGIFSVILAAIILWIGFVLRNLAIIRLLKPMLLPACLIGSAITGFSIFQFYPSVQNETVAAIFLLALAGAFAFAIFKLFSSPGRAGMGSGIE